ncbi:BCCT family transporter [Demequina sp. NBRC 110055]|uniref:BCCT family transporter n=1 Tax=Demequina sp. NBRC 110055 TaxID=1570344 RepID=UPI0027D84B4E|nr:BCCT family transporter [Demequina sp. NBRC 110055]
MSRKALATWVFYPSAILILGFVLFAMIWPEAAESLFDQIQSTIINAFGWYYVLIAAVFVAFALVMGFSRFGNIKLGKDSDKPQFSMFSWFALLFAAGMGIGLVFYGVSEPLAHFATPRPGVGGTPEQLAQQAMSQTFLHWGIHAWAIYIVVGLGIAYAVHRRGRPVSIRYALEPLLGKHIKGGWGNVIDVTAVVGTLFGVATSLGLGVLQISSGLESVGIAEPSTTTQIVLIIVITIVTIFSLVTGLQRGMKWLSNTNLALALFLLLFVLFAGPTEFLMREFVQDLGSYIQNFIGLSFNVSAFQGEAGEEWQAAWTTFYWGWWISWAPFVGVFIARVSKGRTVREFIWGVLLVPSVVTFFWFAVMGGTAIYEELYEGGGLVGPNGEVDYNGSLFAMLDTLPGSTVLTIGAMILIAVFFVTSSDSGSLVLSMLTTGGDESPKRWVRVFWACTTALVAIALLLSGGLSALQTAAIITALPFSIVMIGIMLSTVKAFRREHALYLAANRADFMDHIRDTISGEYGLEPTDADVDPEAARTHLPSVRRWTLGAPIPRRHKKGGAGPTSSDAVVTGTAVAATGMVVTATDDAVAKAAAAPPGAEDHLAESVVPGSESAPAAVSMAGSTPPEAEGADGADVPGRAGGTDADTTPADGNGGDTTDVPADEAPSFEKHPTDQIIMPIDHLPEDHDKQ